VLVTSFFHDVNKAGEKLAKGIDSIDFGSEEDKELFKEINKFNDFAEDMVSKVDSESDKFEAKFKK
jgi:hypothetical protein